jgi:hypothetical protein
MNIIIPCTYVAYRTDDHCVVLFDYATARQSSAHQPISTRLTRTPLSVRTLRRAHEAATMNENRGGDEVLEM